MDRKELLLNFIVTFAAVFLAILLAMVLQSKLMIQQCPIATPQAQQSQSATSEQGVTNPDATMPPAGTGTTNP